MVKAAAQLHLEMKDVKQEESYTGIKETIFKTHTSEFIIGLCGPIGTDIHLIGESIKRILEDHYNYECQIIRLSEFIRLHKKYNPTAARTKSETYHDLISLGNELRKDHGNSILAELAINEIAVSREIKKGDGDEFKSNRICYIIDSIKNKEELDLFRLIYSDLFYFVGVFSNIETRIKNLNKEQIIDAAVHTLIHRDSGEEMNFGQRVTETFLESDFFLRIDNSSAVVIEPKLRRFINLIFSSEIITPTSHETAMYLAYAAAGNSGCLSRQVGATLTDKNGEVISVGWNDVPKAGGGVYQFDENDQTHQHDKRCIYFEDDGICLNDKEKNVLTENVVTELISNNLIAEADKAKAIGIIKKSRIKELIEFTRAVHAEMHAIIIGSQKSGSKIIGGRIYCTTYPCHNCAKHIVAAGIKEVYYIEPYRKSQATRLHSDAISENEDSVKQVRFLMFDGISPKRYLDLFKMQPNSRKKDGKKIQHSLRTVNPKNTLSLQAIPILEKKVTEDLKLKLLIRV
jgi:deoxycytidylate deaminase